MTLRVRLATFISSGFRSHLHARGDLMATTFRGFPACDCLARWLPGYEAELRARGVLAKDATLHIYQLIGGNPSSAGTHTGGGAFDLLDLPGGEDLAIARQMGADATWSRPKGWDGANGIAHIHGVLTGCPHNGPARYQIDAVVNGGNGLGRGGMGGPDDGPLPLSGRTWQAGLAWHREQAKARRRARLTAKIREYRAKVKRLIGRRDQV